MITAKIKYVGNKSGMLARFYSIPQLLGKFDTEEKVQESYQKWIRLTKESDWKLIIE